MISVIIPVYNNPKELKKCLKSLETQTFRDFEVVVVDDGSKEEIRNPWPRPASAGGQKLEIRVNDLDIKYYRIEHGGAPVARNFGFSKSRGEYVLFCDADMELRSDCLLKMLNKLRTNPDKSYVYSDFQYGFKKFHFWEFNEDKLKQNNYINTCSLLRRADFPGFDETLNKFQDWDLWLTLLGQDKVGVYIPEILFKASVSKGKISFWLPKFFYRFKFLKRVEEYEKLKRIVKKKHGIK